MIKNILFITGTRADFGKQKTLMKAVKNDPKFELKIFCTGMHLMSKYGYTISEIEKAGFGDNVFQFINQVEGESMEIILSNTIAGLSRYLHENNIDLIVVHGDRLEALAGSIVGAFKNILVGHIEGGEVSGTIDDLIRHSTTKMSHVHFVANSIAKQRLLQLGEMENCVFEIGSPDVDVMVSQDLPDLEIVKNHYDINFDDYAIAILHPVTTEIDKIKEYANTFVDTLIESNLNYIIIYPNNDLGSEHIFNAYSKFKGNKRFKMYPSVRFEYFLTFLKNCQFIIGNSSAGIHEAPVYGVPTIDVGTRQTNRFSYDSIQNVSFINNDLSEAITYALKNRRFAPTNHYGDGNSFKYFMDALKSSELWDTNHQKKFIDLKIS